MSDKKRAPKKITIDYSKGKIYKIVNLLNLLIYIGSTTQTLPKRFYGHKSDAKRKDSHFYQAMNALGVENFKIVLIENFNCKSKAELEAREYAITNTYARDLLYNTRFDGKMDNENKEKLLAAHFHRGSISHHISKSYHSWQFEWYIDGQKQGKSYSFGTKRTGPAAYMLCKAMQEEIYPLENKDYLAELPFSNDQ